MIPADRLLAFQLGVNLLEDQPEESTMRVTHPRMIHAPAELVDRWLNDERLKKNHALHDLVATGRCADGSFEAHYRVINEILDLTAG